MSFKIICGCLIAVSVFSVLYGLDIKTTKKGDLGDVLVNISKVNGLMQELIQNYKELKKMTNSDLESDYDEKEIRIHEENRQSRNRAEKKVKKTSTTKNRGLATAMFMSDGESGLEIDDSPGESFKDKPRKPKNKKRNTMKSDILFYKNTANAKSKSYTENPDTTPEDNLPDYSNSSIFNIDSTAAPTESLRELMVSFVDDVMTPRSKPAMYTETMPKYVITTTTMYPNLGENLFDIHPSTPSKKHLEPRLENYDTPWLGMRKRLNHRKSRKKTAIIQLRSGKKSKREVGPRRTTKKAKTNKDSASVWEGDKVHKEEKKIKALRQAYGDACLRLVVRKCYMACRGVSRDSCHGKQLCTKNFKATFKRVAIRGCDKEFGKNVSASFRVASRELIEGRGKKDSFRDMTRNGYLAMACLPSESSKSERENTKHTKTKIKPVRRHKKIIAVAKRKEQKKPELLILRDRYEKACSRESATKCFRACKNAIDAAVKEAKNSKKKKDFMIKACKKRCSRAYSARGYSSSDSDSDSDDDESSESDEEKSERKKSDW